MKVVLTESITVGGVTWGPGEYETDGLDEPWKSVLESRVKKVASNAVASEPKRLEDATADGGK